MADREIHHHPQTASGDSVDGGGGDDAYDECERRLMAAYSLSIGLPPGMQMPPVEDGALERMRDAADAATAFRAAGLHARIECEDDPSWVSLWGASLLADTSQPDDDGGSGPPATGAVLADTDAIPDSWWRAHACGASIPAPWGMVSLHEVGDGTIEGLADTLRNLARLSAALRAAGLDGEPREDSRLCEDFVMEGVGDPESIARTMAEMRWLHDRTRYAKLAHAMRRHARMPAADASRVARLAALAHAVAPDAWGCAPEAPMEGAPPSLRALLATPEGLAAAERARAVADQAVALGNAAARSDSDDD